MSAIKYSAYSVQELEQELCTSVEQGLSTVAVKKYQALYGRNVVKNHEIRWWHILFRQCTSPFLLLLVVAAILSFITQSPLDAAVIVIILGINTLLGFYQEYAAYRTVYFLQKFTRSYVRVRRNGHETTVQQDDLVPGDVVLLFPGDIVPADVRFVHTQNLLIDEAVLTGESIPVGKKEGTLSIPAANQVEATNCGFAGTVVVSGTAVAIIYATGKNTVMAEISQLTSEIMHVGVFQQDIASFSKVMMYLIVSTLALVVLINIIIKRESIHFIDLLLFALALALGITPEALPVVATFALARGAHRLAQRKVIVKRLSSIDDLGSIQVLCTDKTGTLTENILTVVATYSYQQQDPLLVELYATTALKTKEKYVADVLDSAVMDYALKQGYVHNDVQLVHEMPYDPLRRRGVVIIKIGDTYELIMRGVYDEVITRCKQGNYRDGQIWNEQQGKEGKRVIAVAKKQLPTLENVDLFEEEKNLTFVGLVAYEDPIKTTAAQAVKEARRLGVTVKVLSGDAPEVVAYVAQCIGLIDSPDQYITGNQFAELSEDQQRTAVQKYAVFARVSPRDKYLIVKYLKEKVYVGFLGDGMNDAPALKAAHVGMVVNAATESARSAADIILLKKSLRVMVDGVKEGRVVFSNTLKYVLIILASNVSDFYSIAILSLFIDFLPLLPVQILLSNLITDIAMLMIATDKVDVDDLRIPTKFDMRRLLMRAAVVGSVCTLCDLSFVLLFIRRSPGDFRTNWFMLSIFTEILLIFSLRSRFFFLKSRMPSYSLMIASVLAVFVGIALPSSMWGQRLFGFVHPQFNDVVVLVGLTFGCIVGVEAVKVVYNRVVNGSKKS